MNIFKKLYYKFIRIPFNFGIHKEMCNKYVVFHEIDFETFEKLFNEFNWTTKEYFKNSLFEDLDRIYDFNEKLEKRREHNKVHASLITFYGVNYRFVDLKEFEKYYFFIENQYEKYSLSEEQRLKICIRNLTKLKA